MGIAKAGQAFVLQCEVGKLFQGEDELGADKTHALLKGQDISVVVDIAGSRPEMDDALCFGAEKAIGINIRHNIMADLFFALVDDVEVDVLDMGLQFVDLVLGNVQSEFLLGLGQKDPKVAEAAHPCPFRENSLHRLASITAGKRRNEWIVFSHVA